MIMPEHEAKARLCPQSMTGANAANRCCASYCMAWRWVSEPDPFGDDPLMDTFVKVRGYCGLAGQP